MKEKRHAIVLAGDYGYIRQIETTLKSICYHNQSLKVYIFNQDIPQEWFISRRKILQQMGSDLVDVKLLGDTIQKGWRLPPFGSHINYMTFARYFIPQFVAEDTVLYLDCDTIVTRDLQTLFETDLSQHYLAASKVIFGLENRFNAGVLLINNKRWKKENIQAELIRVTEEKHQDLQEADQTVLNWVIGEEYVLLEDSYNFQIGYDQLADMRGQWFLFDIPLEPLPAIIHYLSSDKPWNTYSVGRLREVWWQYAMMDWLDVLSGSAEFSLVSEKNRNRKRTLTFTNSQNLEHITFLAEQLPEIDFQVVTFVPMGEILQSLSRYENIKLYPNVMRWRAQHLIETCDYYLDINHEIKFQDMLEMVVEAGKEILSFDATANEVHVDTLFESSHPEEMLAYLKKG